MLAPVGEKREPLLRRVIETWLESGIEELIVVLGKDAEKIQEKTQDFLDAAAADAAADSRQSGGRKPVVKGALRAPLRGRRPLTTGFRPPTPRFVVNPNWEAGMFSSVKIGLGATSASSTHIAISPADLPFLSKGTLRTVIDAATSLGADDKTVVVPTFRRRRGHPLVIPAALRQRILSWPDTARLSLLFEEKDLSVLHLEGFDESILHDVDSPRDLEAGAPAPDSPSKKMRPTANE